MNITESHSRTLVKTVVYRILCTLAIYLIALGLSDDSAKSGSLALTIMVMGSVLYYIHDRVWARFDWRRNYTGYELVIRSFVKTIVYRLITLGAAIGLAKLIMTDSTQTAVTFALAQFVVTMLLYYVVERIFNRINYGRETINGV